MLIVANYKNNGDSKFYATLIQKINKVKDTNLVLCPPFVFLPQFKNLKRHKLGAQNVDCSPALTGGISAEMLKEFNCAYALVGHCERRPFETDKLAAQKVQALQKVNITPIVCVGETDRGAGYANFKHQVMSALKLADKNKQIVFAYEPVWCVGTGELPSAKHVGDMVKHIKNSVKKFGIEGKVLYGGSIDENNFKNYMSTNIDGFLVGRLAMQIDNFINFLRSVYGK